MNKYSILACEFSFETRFPVYHECVMVKRAKQRVKVADSLLVGLTEK